MRSGRRQPRALGTQNPGIHYKPQGLWGPQNPRIHDTPQKLTTPRAPAPSQPSRTTPTAAWVATVVDTPSFEVAVKNGSAALFCYFWGGNAEGLRMKETVPLAVQYRTDLHPHTGETRNFSVAMFLPYEHQVRRKRGGWVVSSTAGLCPARPPADWRRGAAVMR